MSLVAYAASSDDGTDCDDDEHTTTVTNLQEHKTDQVRSSGHITDEGEHHYHEQIVLPSQDCKPSSSISSLSLPKPKNSNEQTDHLITPSFAKLPMPRALNSAKETIQEEDDEFLHKKAIPVQKKLQDKPVPSILKERVRITIPSLNDFKDVDTERANRAKIKDSRLNKPKGSGLLSILPKAKSEQNFSKASNAKKTESTSVSSALPAFIPDTVKNRRPAQNTEGVDGIRTIIKKSHKQKVSLVNFSDSDASEDDAESATIAGDFFSLHKEDKLPEVSSNEINQLVAKRAAKIMEATSNYLQEQAQQEAAEKERLRLKEEQQLSIAQKQYQHRDRHLNDEAIEALMGTNAKRRRKEQKEMNIIDISSQEVLPDREEWMRTALASSTTYQPTGVLTDEEPAAGTRRKHQITYLAHKAKSNEAELQAMWASNRQTRRATQSKYGF